MNTPDDCINNGLNSVQDKYMSNPRENHLKKGSNRR